jgi:hypothetical protein
MVPRCLAHIILERAFRFYLASAEWAHEAYVIIGVPMLVYEVVSQFATCLLLPVALWALVRVGLHHSPFLTAMLLVGVVLQFRLRGAEQ